MTMPMCGLSQVSHDAMISHWTVSHMFTTVATCMVDMLWWAQYSQLVILYNAED